MNTEQHIREAFNKQFDPDSKGTHFNTFEDGYKAGYMALLNELEQCAVLVVDKEVKFRSVHLSKNVWKLSDGSHYLYALPEGVVR